MLLVAITLNMKVLSIYCLLKILVECVLCIIRVNIEIIIGNETDEIIEKCFESFLQKCQKDLEESVKGSKFAFDSVDLLYYKLHKISVNHGGSYIDSPKWLKKKKSNIKF